MEQRSRKSFLFLPIVLSISLCGANSHGIKNQADVLGRFYRDKFFDESKGIDASEFEILESAIEDDDDLHAAGPLDSSKAVGSPDMGLREKDRIVQLPGQPPVQFNQYGGYVTVDASNGRAFFYYFVEADNSKKDSLPLLLWLNGGDIRKYCNFSQARAASDGNKQSPECVAATEAADMNVMDIDIYNIYAHRCHNSNLTSKPRRASVMKYEPCSDRYVYACLNRPEVQEALHANVTKLKNAWDTCNYEVLFTWGDSPSTIIPLLQEFMANGLRVWVFSGDTDGSVPVTGTQCSIDKMNLTVKTPWHPWYNAAEVGGYTLEYEGGLTFATVRGAAHMVPTFQPGRALALVSRFLSGTPLPSTDGRSLS